MSRGHRLSQVDPDTLRGVCEACGPVQVYRRTKGGFLCAPGQRARMREYRRTDEGKAYRAVERPHLAHRKGACERCGFTGLHDAALAVHHLDLNHGNNDPSNLMTLCLNCHAEVHANQRAAEEDAS